MLDPAKASPLPTAAGDQRFHLPVGYRQTPLFCGVSCLIPPPVGRRLPAGLVRSQQAANKRVPSCRVHLYVRCIHFTTDVPVDKTHFGKKEHFWEFFRKCVKLFMQYDKNLINFPPLPFFMLYDTIILILSAQRLWKAPKNHEGPEVIYGSDL